MRCDWLLAALVACVREPEVAPQIVSLPEVPHGAVSALDASLPMPATSPDITGTWRIAEGRAQGGSSYTGTVAFSVHGSALDLDWDVSGTAYTGVGLQRGNHVYAGWGTGDEPRVIVYRTQPDGSLHGEWTTRALGGIGMETASGGGPHGLGAYTVRGTDPSGSAYSGTLNISSDADVFNLTWDVGDHYVGTGLADGDRLAVGFGHADVGYVEYVFEGKTAKGRWTWIGSSGIYVENLERD